MHRVKDLHDLRRLPAVSPVQDETFWRDSASEFRLACESRLVDCVGLASFLQDGEATRKAYVTDATLNTVQFVEGEQGLLQIIDRFQEFELFPLGNPLVSSVPKPDPWKRSNAKAAPITGKILFRWSPS